MALVAIKSLWIPDSYLPYIWSTVEWADSKVRQHFYNSYYPSAIHNYQVNKWILALTYHECVHWFDWPTNFTVKWPSFVWASQICHHHLEQKGAVSVLLSVSTHSLTINTCRWNQASSWYHKCPTVSSFLFRFKLFETVTESQLAPRGWAIYQNYIHILIWDEILS